MTTNLTHKHCLVSVYNKEGLLPIVKKLYDLGVIFYSTGGTESFLNENKIPCVRVEDITEYPSILGGRVKTLHPKIFGGILARRDIEEDLAQMHQYQIPDIDLVIVDLYPFEETVAHSNDEKEIIEKIDIGGISLIRAAAKNFKDVLIISDRNQYPEFLKHLGENKNVTTLEQRKIHATRAFHTSSHYDSKIFQWMNAEKKVDVYKESIATKSVMRYGENPHQKGTYYGDLTKVFTQLQGKELSYNNLVDCEATIQVLDEFVEPTVVIVKHTNSCGVATRDTLVEAWDAALAGDPVSAFGGVIAVNKNLDLATAEKINKLFFEVLIAPAFDEDVLELLKQKTNRILLQRNPEFISNKLVIKNVFNGMLVQDKDLKNATQETITYCTEIKPSETQLDDLFYGEKIVKHLKSNGIAIVKNKQLIGMGCGHTSRVDALNQAIIKAKNFGFDVRGSVMVSEAFFPFPDCVQIAAESGITAIMQPGGSIKDQDSIDACNEKNIAMILTGIRHFKH